jgi:hypothetical protein
MDGAILVVSSADGTRVFVAGGADFAGGAPTGAALSDAWAVDATVCLLGAAGTVCSGHGVADATTVTCACDPAWQGDDRCGTCTAGTYGPTCASTCPSGAGGFCNSNNGWGVCDSSVGCICSGQHTGAACDQCNSGYWGSSCAACAPCSANGVCDGSGTTSGGGNCICNAGWFGPDCSEPDALAISPSRAPAAGSGGGGGGGLGAGGAFAVALLVIGAAAGGGLYIFAAFFGGGPALAAAAAKARAMLPSGFGFGGGNERVGLLAGSKAGALSPVAAHARFGNARAGAGKNAFAATSVVVDDPK